jgi:hypothetical protein
MAKKSSIEKNNRRRKMAKSFAGRRERLKTIVRDKSKPVEERFAVCHPYPQPLRIDGPAARLLPQAQAVAHRAPRTGLEGADPGPGEVELVRRIARCP